MSKKTNNIENKSTVKNERRVFGTDRNRINRFSRVMAIVMVVVMVAFSFITAGMFLLD